MRFGHLWRGEEKQVPPLAVAPTAVGTTSVLVEADSSLALAGFTGSEAARNDKVIFEEHFPQR
jgi:hypothetical protein